MLNRALLSEIHAEDYLNCHQGKFSGFFHFRDRIFLNYFRDLLKVVLQCFEKEKVEAKVTTQAHRK